MRLCLECRRPYAEVKCAYCGADVHLDDCARSHISRSRSSIGHCEPDRKERTSEQEMEAIKILRGIQYEDDDGVRILALIRARDEALHQLEMDRQDRGKTAR